MILLLLLASITSWASAPSYWSHVLEVTDRHEFYQNHELLTTPKDSWQHLYSLIYIDGDLNRLKDCVFLRVPGQEAGELKVKTISAADKCDDFLFTPGDVELKNVKSLQFAILDSKILMDITLNDFRNEKWHATIQHQFIKPQPAMGLSSAEFKAPNIIFLAPITNAKVSNKQPFLKDGSLCHNIDEDCQEVAQTTCDQCAEGWYEIPNGCFAGPKLCGLLKCGGKDQPACRRGMRWQRKEEAFECRLDASFAYCSKGLKVECEGKKAYCR